MLEILITLPEDSYKATCNSCMLPPDVENVVNAIKNGKILPKGHKRLIYEPTGEEIENTVGGQNDFAECIRDSVKAVFDNATTIIPEDKESK